MEFIIRTTIEVKGTGEGLKVWGNIHRGSDAPSNLLQLAVQREIERQRDEIIKKLPSSPNINI